MRLLTWLLKFFEAPRAAPRRVKFVEGTEWLCPHCRATIAIARHDIYVYDVARSSDWDAKDVAFWTGRTHCGEHLHRYDSRGILIFTPTGWVG